MATFTRQEVRELNDLTNEMKEKTPMVGRHCVISVSTRQIARWSDVLTKLIRESKEVSP
jgi:hypothetical protein